MHSVTQPDLSVRSPCSCLALSLRWFAALFFQCCYNNLALETRLHTAVPYKRVLLGAVQLRKLTELTGVPQINKSMCLSKPLQITAEQKRKQQLQIGIKVAPRKPTIIIKNNLVIFFYVYIEFLEIPPFNKQYTECQLRAGAGYILEDFNEAQVRQFFFWLPTFCIEKRAKRGLGSWLNCRVLCHSATSTPGLGGSGVERAITIGFADSLAWKVGWVPGMVDP